MTQAVHIRRATREDAATLHALVVALADMTGHRAKVTSTLEDFEHHGFDEPVAFEGLIAEEDGKPVGLCLFFYNFSSWRGRLGVYIQDIYVAESQRGTGLGKRLVAETVRRGKERGADHLRLSVDFENSGAHRFYEHIGMWRRDDEDIYQADGEAFETLAQLDQ